MWAVLLAACRANRWQSLRTRNHLNESTLAGQSALYQPPSQPSSMSRRLSLDIGSVWVHIFMYSTYFIRMFLLQTPGGLFIIDYSKLSNIMLLSWWISTGKCSCLIFCNDVLYYNMYYWSDVFIWSNPLASGNPKPTLTLKPCSI